MPLYSLHRDRPLTEEEWALLPRGCSPVNEGGDVVARAEADGPLLDLLLYTATLARAVPDARLVIRLPAAVVDLPAGAARAAGGIARPLEAVWVEVESSPAAQAPAGEPVDPELLREDPWELLDRGDLDRAEARFRAAYELDMEGRDRVRNLFYSTDPAQAALGCRIAGYTGWKSFVTTMRRALVHADVRVRRDATAAIGKLAGPALLPALEERLTDPSPEVQAAAREAVARIRGKETPRVRR